jgi:acyl-coenzyme A synthetase/AMP-(fatty) acid ligase
LLAAIATIPWASDLKSVADRYGDSEAVSDGERTLSFNALAASAAGLATALQQAGVKPGEPVAPFLRNGLAAVWASYGIRLSGAAETPINPGFGEAELRYCVELARVRRVVTTQAQAGLFRALGCDIVAVEDVVPDRAALAAPAPVPAAAWARVSFTSGTTGKPKAIVHTHLSRWLSNVLQRASLPMRPGPENRILLMTPFTHGASILTYAFVDHGARVVLLDGVDLPRVEALLAAGAVDHVFAPPTVLAKLAAAFEGRHFAGIRTIFCGTAALTPALYEKARALFGPVVRVTYGKSEINNPITVLPPDECERYYRAEGAAEGVCVGWPGTGVEIELRREDGGRCEAGESGEVHLRARHMSAGLIDADGFHVEAPDAFHATGDLGRLDERGRLHLLGRTADVIKSGGYKIHPDEIELALAGCLGNAALTVVALPSEYWGEVIVAVAEGIDGDWSERGRSAVAGLARFKQPRAYLTLATLPRNAQGKIPRRQVREMVLARYTLVDGPRPRLAKR